MSLTSVCSRFVRIHSTTFGQKYCPLASSMNLLARLCISSDSNAPFFSHCERSHSVRQRPPRFICHRQRSSALPFLVRVPEAKEKESVQKDKLFFWRAERKGLYRSRFAPLEKCRNSPLDCFSVASFVATLRVHSHFWFESLTSRIPKRKSDCPKGQSLFLARCKGLEPLAYWFVASHSIQLS